MVGVKRDYTGGQKAVEPKEVARNEYTSMFETFRDELDHHQDRRQRVIKVSKDVTGLSKKIIFSLQRVRKLNEPITPKIAAETKDRIKEIKDLLQTIEEDVQGINRYRYNLSCLEEFIEAISFAHYLEHQTLISPEQCAVPLESKIPFTAADYVFGIFDLTGEMMRFATAVTALTGSLPGNAEGRTILGDLQETASMLLIVPPIGGNKTYEKKVEVMVEQVRKVERVGYGIVVRGNERPKGWMPDMNEANGGEREGSPG